MYQVIPLAKHEEEVRCSEVSFVLLNKTVRGCQEFSILWSATTQLQTACVTANVTELYHPQV